MNASPFLKWAGGKRKLAKTIVALLTRQPTFGIRRYYEPFLGAGAVFFELASQLHAPIPAYLSDLNQELTTCFRVVRRDVYAVADLLEIHGKHHSEPHYYDVRAWSPESLTEPEQAARTIYLNKAGFNGLYRVNKKGEFNVPWGEHESVAMSLPSRSELAECSGALLGSEIVSLDFEEAVAGAKAGDAVYFDPPYVPASKTAKFTNYTPGGFTKDDQRRLAHLVTRLARKGVRVVASAADSPFVRELYADHEVFEVTRAGTMNSDPQKRGKVAELLIVGRA